MIYQVRIQNSMFGYENDVLRDIEAACETEALEVAHQIDPYAVCTVLGTIKEQEKIERQQSYWDFMRDGKTQEERLGWDVYLAGSLRNPAIPSIMDELHYKLNAKVFADWYAAGPEADDHWKSFYKGVGYSYVEALKEPASVNTFEFDRRNMLVSKTMVLVLPAGKSGHLELGWFLGKGKPGYILLDSNEDRWDVMYQFATGVTADMDELAEWIRKDLGNE